MDIISDVMQQIMLIEHKEQLKVLHELLQDCLVAGFSKEEVEKAQIMMLWMLFNERLKHVNGGTNAS